MFIIRPIEQGDLKGLKKIAVDSGHGFTSLPDDEKRLQDKIDHSVASTEQKWQGRGEDSYLFVLEDLSTGNIVGTTGIEASVGLSEPLYHYRKSQVVHRSTGLGLTHNMDILTVCNDYAGTTEICTLYLDNNFRKNKLGRFLSKVRFMFMADHQERFSDIVIAEMRGVANDDGIPPFWHWLQQTFFTIEFATADHLVGTGNKGFIADLMPTYPIYINTLCEQAQAAIAQVHKNTKPALELLKAEGFEHRGYVDLFDAGPTVETKLKHITSVTNSFLVDVAVDNRIADEIEFDRERPTFALSNQQIKEFRACLSQTAVLSQDKQQIRVSAKLADVLKVGEGDKLRVLAV